MTKRNEVREQIALLVLPYEEIRVLFIQAFLDYMLKEDWVKEIK